MLWFKPKKQNYSKILNRYCVRDWYIHITDMDVYLKKKTKVEDWIYVDQEWTIKDPNHVLEQYISRPEVKWKLKRISPLKDVSAFTKRKSYDAMFTWIMFTPDCIRGTDTFGIIRDDTDHGIKEEFVVHIDAYKALMKMNQYNLQYRVQSNKEGKPTYYEFYDGKYSLIWLSIKWKKIDLKELPFYKSKDYELLWCYDFSESIKIWNKIKAKRIRFKEIFVNISNNSLEIKIDSNFPLNRYVDYKYIKFFHNKFASFNSEWHSKVDLWDWTKILVRAIKY